jgi:hypothetical protein
MNLGSTVAAKMYNYNCGNTYEQEYTNTVRWITQAPKFYMVTPNIFGFSV